MASSTMLEEKLAIFTVSYEVTEREVRNYMIQQWHQITIGMKDSTILFIIGVHGSSKGKLGDKNSSTMRTQMDKIFKRDAPELQKDKEERNIKFEYLDLFEFIEDKKLNEDSVLLEINRINAQMTVMVICYSNTLDLKFLLEEKGLFSEARINRDLNILSKGKILTLNETQKKFIQTVAHPENIEKKIVRIEGKVGSGKTLLGTEIVKMKLAHYIRKYNLQVNEMKQQKMKVIILADEFNANVLVQQLKEELFKDISQYCDIEIASKAIREGVLHTFMEEDANFIHTIVMIDECYADKSDYYVFQPTDCIYCIRYSQVGIKPKATLNNEDVFVTETMVHCDLRLCQRSSWEILKLANYLQMHSPNTFPFDLPQNSQSFSGTTPLWVEVNDPKDLLELIPELKESLDKDVMLIREHTDDDIEEICQTMGWKCCHVSEVTGCEASVVFIYDPDQFRYEAFTRAKNMLVIVTLPNRMRSFTNALKSIKSGVHEMEHCDAYFKRLSKKSNFHSVNGCTCPFTSDYDYQIKGIVQTKIKKVYKESYFSRLKRSVPIPFQND